MKKLYSTVALALTASMAFAVGNVRTQQGPLKFHSNDKPIVLSEEFKAAKEQKANKKPAKSPISNVNSLYTNYVWFGIDIWDEQSKVAQSEIAIEQGSSTNEVNIYGINQYSDVVIKGYVNQSAGTITIPSNQAIYTNIGIQTENGVIYSDVVVALADLDADGYLYYPGDDIILTWDAETEQLVPNGDVISYRVKDYDGGIGGYFLNSFYLLPQKLSNDPNQFTFSGWDEYGYVNGWKDAGMATIENVWMSNYFTDLPQGVDKYNVPYQVNTTDPNLIRLTNVYGKGTPWETLNQSVSEGSVIINLEDPDMVLVFQAFNQQLPYVNAAGNNLYGEVANLAGLMVDNLAFYPGNMEGYYYYILGATYEDILGSFPDEEFSSYKDNVIYLPSAGFGMSFYAGDTWNQWVVGPTENDTDIMTPVTINLDTAGVESIGSEELNTTARYFNLQGIELTNPAKGQVVIKKEGNKSVKMIVK